MLKTSNKEQEISIMHDFEFELDCGFTIELSAVTIVLTVYHEPNYGADADGRRGISIFTIEDWDIPEQNLEIEITGMLLIDHELPTRATLQQLMENATKENVADWYEAEQ